MNERNYPGSGDCTTQAPKQETLPSLLDEIAKLSCQVRDQVAMASNNLHGVNPSNPCEKPPQDNSIIGRVRAIRSILREAEETQQHVLNSLAL